VGERDFTSGLGCDFALRHSIKVGPVGSRKDTNFITGVEVFRLLSLSFASEQLAPVIER
jgi:hypothetical protein